MKTRRDILLKPLTGLAVLSLLAAGVGLRTLSAPAPKAKIAAGVKAAPIRLLLTAERRGMVSDTQGRTQETWQALADGVGVQPGDVLRYTLRVQNGGALPVKNFVLTQPVPSGMVLQPGTVTVSGADGVQTLFRIDGQAGYSAAPTISAPQPDGSVRSVPAPAEAYRAVRWVFAQPVAPAQDVRAVYTEKVR